MSLMTIAEFNSVVAELRGKKFPVLSNGGVTLVDALGRDQKVCEVARTTSDIESTTDDKDINLLRYLLRHAHNTPFEFCIVDLLLDMPMDVARQHNRHRAFTINEFSTRYSEVPEVNEVTSPEHWRMQSESNRQGSSDQFVTKWPDDWSVIIDDSLGIEDYVLAAPHEGNGIICNSLLTPGAFLSIQERKIHKQVFDNYNTRLHFGVAKEQARKDLCLSTYTRMRWTGDLRNMLGYLLLRMDSHAQYEIRQFANTIAEKIIAKLFPQVWQAFLDYEVNAMKLTALDIAVINRITEKPLFVMPVRADTLDASSDIWPVQWRNLNRCRERDECLEKLRRLGIVVWT